MCIITLPIGTLIGEVDEIHPLLYLIQGVPKMCDVVHSVLETLSEFIAHSTYYGARVAGVRRIYFVGNFIHPPIIRKWVTQNLTIQNGINPKVHEF